MVYFTMASLPYAALLSWTLLPGMLFMWVLIPWMIICLIFSYLLRLDPSSISQRSLRSASVCKAACHGAALRLRGGKLTGCKAPFFGPKC